MKNLCVQSSIYYCSGPSTLEKCVKDSEGVVLTRAISWIVSARQLALHLLL